MYDYTDKLYRIWDKALRCLYPKHCSVCGKIIPLNKDYCACSRKESARISDDYCIHCGHDSIYCSCSTKNTVHLPSVAGVYIYGGQIRSDILDLKFNNARRLAVKLGTAMADRCAKVYCDIDFDIITYVPMRKSSLDRRGYNQSRLLAEQVGKMLMVPVEELLIKSRDTKSQHTLGGNERIENVRSSVKIKEGISIKNKKILICDDVKTTGATLDQCVKALKENEASEICCICVAVTNFS